MPQPHLNKNPLRSGALNAIIVDDEPYSCEVLATLLSDLANVQVNAVCNNGADALKAIHTHAPDIVFLDVEMPGMNGFEMLEQLPVINFHIVFTTSYNEYALKAIRFSALDYLLKPIDPEELKKAVEKAVHKSQVPITKQLQLLMEKIHQPLKPVSRIAMPTLDGLQMIRVASIISCESDSNYTIIKLKENKKLVVCRTLKEMEELLQEHSFVRVHRCFLANLNEVEKYVKGDGGYLIMSDGSNIDVSKNRKELLLSQLLPKKQ